MSVPRPSSKHGSVTHNSASLRRTPLRKQGQTGGHGDSRPKSCAEFHGKKGRKLPSYAASHSCFDPKENFGLQPYQQVLGSDQTNRYIKRIPYPLPPGNRTSGIVGPEMDYSVRGRNLPIIFCKQIRHAAQFARMSSSGHPVWKAILLLFCDPNRTLLGHERPNAGCHQTRRWTDAQVRTWTQLANWLGIQFSGDREYAFPKKSLGVVRGGEYHHNDRTLSEFPWPGTENFGLTEAPKFRFERNGRKRSPVARIKRSFQRSKKIGIKPIPIEAVIQARKIIPSSKVYSFYTHDRPISSFKETIPTVLSLRYGPALQLSPIVMDSLRRIYSTPKKFMIDKSWLVPDGKELKYEVSIPKPQGQRAFKRESIRLRPFFSADGNVYALPYLSSNRHMFASNERKKIHELTHGDKHFPTFKESEALFEKYSDMIDDYEENNRQVPGILGSWFD